MAFSHNYISGDILSKHRKQSINQVSNQENRFTFDLNDNTFLAAIAVVAISNIKSSPSILCASKAIGLVPSTSCNSYAK